MILDGDQHKLEQYVVTIADLMGLKDWRFQVKVSEITSDHVLSRNTEAGATIEPLWANKSAVITFAPNWHERGPEDVRESVVHELVHAHLSHYTWMVGTLEKQLGALAFGVFEDAMHIVDEYTTEAISIAWAETLPLPIEYADHVEESD